MVAEIRPSGASLTSDAASPASAAKFSSPIRATAAPSTKLSTSASVSGCPAPSAALRLAAPMIEMLNVEGVVLEPAGALSIDALRDLDVAGRTVVAVVSGGNFDFERLPDVKERALRWEGRKKYYILRLPQRPGALREFLEMLGPDDDIARFEYLKKSARNFGSVLIGIETRAPDNFAGLEARVAAAGFTWLDITDDAVITNLII